MCVCVRVCVFVRIIYLAVVTTEDLNSLLRADSCVSLYVLLVCVCARPRRECVFSSSLCITYLEVKKSHISSILRTHVLCTVRGIFPSLTS
jgi:hypothetical protein